MIETSQLHVYFSQQIVGTIYSNTAGIMGFQYDSEWLTKGFALSQTLPLQTQSFQPEAATAHRFFTNLLPEATTRVHIIRDLKIPDSDYELLKAIGGECAGALSILPYNIEPLNNQKYKVLDQDDLKKLQLRKGYTSLTAPEQTERPRLSLAGAQGKCPILYDGENYLLPLQNSPSTHILKFEMADYKNVPLFEYITTALAKRIGLPVVEMTFKAEDDGPMLLIKRYDRIIEKNITNRLHQEDFCQALGLGYQHKYGQHGGPSFETCYQLIKDISASPINDCENLLRWQLFNILAGNSDGHAKNISLLYQNRKTRLAPFYDLVCTRAIEHLDSKLALSIAGEFNPDKISTDHLQQLAKDCNIRSPYLNKTINHMISNIKDNLAPTIKEFEDEYGSYPAIQRITKVIKKQCRMIQNKLKR